MHYLFWKKYEKKNFFFLQNVQNSIISNCMFFFFSFFKKILIFEFFCLSDRFLSSSRKLVSVTAFSPNFFSPAVGWLNLRKLVTATVFLPKIFSPAVGWLIYELHFGIIFSLKKLSKKHYWVASLTLLWVKKEFPNVTRKIISSPQAKNFRQKYGRCDKFS